MADIGNRSGGGRIGKGKREEIKNQVWSGIMRGLPPQDIARSLSISTKTVNRMVDEELKRREHEVELNKENENRKLALFQDRLLHALTTAYWELENAADKEMNKSGYLNTIVHIIELLGKSDGLFKTRIVGNDGGAIEIKPVTDKDEAVKRIEALYSQLKELNAPPQIIVEELDEENN